MKTEDLNELADKLNLAIRYKGYKPLKPDVLYEVEFHFALERFKAGKHPMEHLSPPSHHCLHPTDPHRVRH